LGIHAGFGWKNGQFGTSSELAASINSTSFLIPDQIKAQLRNINRSSHLEPPNESESDT